MKKLLAALFLLASFQLTAQTLFHYGKDSVSVNDFLKAYKKNNTGQKTEKAFREYLDLYIASRLKIAEAIEMGLDTLPQMVSDMQNLRQQLVPSYLVDRKMMKDLADEAFRRSLKEIHVAHIFISFEKADDRANSEKKKNELVQELKSKGPAAFSALAKKYSDDPSAKDNGGDMGWITVFSLPYELENLAYLTAPGKVSEVHQSKAGYHIFKNIGERKAKGKIKAAQILFAFPPDADNAYKAAMKKRADSVYQRLVKGDDFNKMVKEFSNDVISAASNGQIPEFGVGEYDTLFEKQAFSLTRDGAFTKPFLTPHGYHIVKRIKHLPVSTVNTPQVQEVFLNYIELNDRIRVVKSKQYTNILSQVAVTEPAFSLTDISFYSDSILNYAPPKSGAKINSFSVLFEIADRKHTIQKAVTAADWIGYAQVYRFKSDGTGMKDYSTLWKEFMQAQISSYYESNLEKFNDEFRHQLHEFRDGNLFFEVMQQKVWGPAQTDTNALRSYYEKNRTKYIWKPGADAVIFFAADESSAKSFIAALSKSPASWSELAGENTESISADSGRFEMSQIPLRTKQAIRPGMITTPVVNSKDKSVSFAYIIRLYTEPAQRNFSDAKGLVISDYQAEIEKHWISELRKKYTVRLNEVEMERLLGEKKWL